MKIRNERRNDGLFYRGAVARGQSLMLMGCLHPAPLAYRVSAQFVGLDRDWLACLLTRPAGHTPGIPLRTVE